MSGVGGAGGPSHLVNIESWTWVVGGTGWGVVGGSSGVGGAGGPSHWVNVDSSSMLLLLSVVESLLGVGGSGGPSHLVMVDSSFVATSCVSSSLLLKAAAAASSHVGIAVVKGCVGGSLFLLPLSLSLLLR